MATPNSMRNDLTAEEVRRLLDYDLETGIFTWRKRPASTFMRGQQTAEHKAAAWNARWAGAAAGTVDDRGYREIHINNCLYYAHRLAWLWVHGEWPPDQIDHINGDSGDNRFANLRASTQSQNMANRRLNRDNTSGFKGVTWDAKAQRWKAHLNLSEGPRHLGHFDTAEEAHAAYWAAAQKHFGEFARAE